MNQILRSDWLPERTSWSYISCLLGITLCVPRENRVLSVHIINPLMTNLFQSRWLILASFLRVDLDFKSQLDCEVEISITNQVRIICCFRINREDFTENTKKSTVILLTNTHCYAAIHGVIVLVISNRPCSLCDYSQNCTPQFLLLLL